MRSARIAAILLVLASAFGCSEKPAGFLVWKQDHMTLKTALGDVALLPSTELIAVGHSIPEFSLIAHPISLLYATTTGWTQIPMPSPPSGSVALHGVAVDATGRAWAVGRTVSSEAEPFDPVPLAHRYEAGAWSQESLADLGPLPGLTLTGVAAGGSAATPEVRAVGDVSGTSGMALQWKSGAWSIMAVPNLGSDWTLHSVAYGIDGVWYAVGRRGGASGGTVLIDRGQGWTEFAGPPMDVDWTAVACDGRGMPYVAGNVATAGELHGVLCRLRHGEWEDVPIARRTSGEFHFLGMGFDVEGNGWAVGGRASSGPFLAGYTPHGWAETPLEAEAEAHPDNETVSGGDLTGVVVDGELNAVSVGSALEVGPEGESEFQPRIFRLGFKRANEVDGPMRVSP